MPKCVLIDETAFHALLFPEDTNHTEAVRIYEKALDQYIEIWAPSYVLIEIISTLHKQDRILKSFLESIDGIVHIFWSDESTYNAAIGQIINNKVASFPLKKWLTIEIAQRLKASLFSFENAYTNMGLAIIH